MKNSIFELLYNPDHSKEIIMESYRLKQIKNFIFDQNRIKIKEFHNLPQKTLDNLIEQYEIISLSKVTENISSDGTRKFLFQLKDGQKIESVVLTDENDRVTFCISTQSGCKMGCTICQTGVMGFYRNLSFHEILSQILFLKYNRKKLDNIVLMGMGEPLDNLSEVSRTIDLLCNEMKFSPNRITLSTCGLPDKIREFTTQFPRVRLALSLNSVIQEKREKIMPITKKYPLIEIFKALHQSQNKYKKRITLEYVMIKNFNIGQEDLDGFKNLSRNYHINLIPYHSSDKKMVPDLIEINYFYQGLVALGFKTTIRKSKGQDIEAACGQLIYHYKKNENCEKKS